MSNVLVLDQLPKSSATNPQPRKRLGAQTTLAFATAAAAFVAMVGTAQAQDCVNGYRMVKDEIPVACSVGHFRQALALFAECEFSLSFHPTSPRTSSDTPAPPG